MMGHMVDALEYNKAHRDENWTLSEYRKALPMLQLMSRGEPYGLVNTDEVDNLRRVNEELKKQLDQQNTDMKAELAELRRLVTEELKKTP